MADRSILPASHDADHGEVQVVEYDPKWASELFPRWSQRAVDCVNSKEDGLTLQIHHIGSTAVPGLKAKPIVDMLLVVKDLQAFDSCKGALEECGFIWCGERFPGGRYLYGKEDGRVQCHLHVAPAPLTQRSGAVIAFRDALRQNDELRDEYSTLKVKLAVECGEDRGAYNQGKTAFVMKALKAYAEAKAKALA